MNFRIKNKIVIYNNENKSNIRLKDILIFLNNNKIYKKGAERAN